MYTNVSVEIETWSMYYFHHDCIFLLPHVQIYSHLSQWTMDISHCCFNMTGSDVPLNMHLLMSFKPPFHEERNLAFIIFNFFSHSYEQVRDVAALLQAEFIVQYITTLL